MNGPPLSPGHAWISGVRLLLRSSPQISERMIACGYAFLQAAAEITDTWPVWSDLGSAIWFGRVLP